MGGRGGEWGEGVVCVCERGGTSGLGDCGRARQSYIVHTGHTGIAKPPPPFRSTWHEG